MKGSWSCIFAFCVAGLAAAADNTVRLLPTSIEMPRRIGPLTQVAAPHKYDDPRLGVSYQFDGQGLSLTVYVYDAGVPDIADGPNSVATCRQYEEAKFGIAQGNYRNIVLRSEQLVRLDPAADSPLAREAVYEFERETHSTVSYIWITAVDKNFLKLRFSVDARLRDELPDARRAVLHALGEAVKPHLRPEPEAKTAGASLNLTMAKGSDDEMAFGLMYLVMLTTSADATPESGPVCGGEWVPSFEGELAALRGVLAVDQADSGSQIYKRLAATDAAGFLEELVWQDMRRDSWGTVEPEGLTLAEFARWRKKHLKRFRMPNLGSVVIDRPRPLPLEPPVSP